jgi:hypothetical protein
MLHKMSKASNILGQKGWALRSGHADGADAAFEAGAMRGEIHLPWVSYNLVSPRNHRLAYVVPWETDQIRGIAAAHHPAWHRLSRPVQSLMCRNVTIILGAEVNDPVKFIVCWTPDGKASGGTGQALRLASTHKIPVFNTFWNEDVDRLDDFIEANP